MNYFDYSKIPTACREGLANYIAHGVPTGDFLWAVLTNNLRGAVERADDDNIKIIPIYVHWLYNLAPAACWGSEAKVTAWLAGREPWTQSLTAKIDADRSARLYLETFENFEGLYA